MVIEYSFNNLPFVPVQNQVIYAEPSYNEKINKFICANYVWLRNTFRSQGLDFCYLPLLAEEFIGYHAPYLNKMHICMMANLIPPIARYIADGSLQIPSLLFGNEALLKDSSDNSVLQGVPITTTWHTSLEYTFENLAKEIKGVLCQHNQRNQISDFTLNDENERSLRLERYNNDGFRKKHSCEQSTYQLKYCVENESGIRFSIGKNIDTEEADKNFDDQSLLLIDEIKQRIDSLRNRGVNTMFLHTIIDEGEHLSRLRITKDHHIFLVDYNNMEIKLPILPKAVYILFLRHPEGIRFKELSDYYSELLSIYLMLNPIGTQMRQEQSIRDITNPCNNSINEKCARIREAFVRNFDNRLAQHYYVTGKRGEAKRITLNQSMIIWEK